MEREKIDLTHEELMNLWNGVYHKGKTYNLKGELYEQIMIKNTSDMSDGDSWDYIIQRVSDKKCFKFNVWDAGTHNGYIFEDKFLIEVFEKQTFTYE